jgi:anti-repressor protein
MNEIVTIVAGHPVTSTLAIAEGTAVDHASVIKLVRTYQGDLEEFGGVGFEIQPFETAGGTQQREIATLSEQQATLILTYMRNSEIVRTFKKRLVKEFWELTRLVDQPTKYQIPQTLPEALRLAADLADQNRQLENKVIVMTPKAAALDRIATVSDGSFCITDAAKALQVQPRKLFGAMQARHWIYRRPMGSGWLAYQDKIQQGLMEHKVTRGEKSDGSEWSETQARITAKGMAKFAEILATGGEAA